MDETEFGIQLKRAIDIAAHNEHVSIKELASRLGRCAATLHRWRAGQFTSIDLKAVVELFQMAGLSMDEAFQLELDAHGTQGNAHLALIGNLEIKIEELESEARQINSQLHSAQSLVTALETILGSLSHTLHPISPAERLMMDRRALSASEVSVLPTVQGDAVTSSERLAEAHTNEDDRSEHKAKIRGA